MLIKFKKSVFLSLNLIFLALFIGIITYFYIGNKNLYQHPKLQITWFTITFCVTAILAILAILFSSLVFICKTHEKVFYYISLTLTAIVFIVGYCLSEDHFPNQVFVVIPVYIGFLWLSFVKNQVLQNISRIIQYILSVVALFVCGIWLSLCMMFGGYSHTADIDEYLVLDNAIKQEELSAYFPSKDNVEHYADQEEYEVSYSYDYHPGMIGNIVSTFDVVLKIQYKDSNEFEEIKERLISAELGRLEYQDNVTKIVVKDDDVGEELEASLLYYIDINDLDNTITYVAQQSRS